MMETQSSFFSIVLYAHNDGIREVIFAQSFGNVQPRWISAAISLYGGHQFYAYMIDNEQSSSTYSYSWKLPSNQPLVIG